MPQAARPRSRAPVVFLLLVVLLAIPAFAEEQERSQAPRELGFLVSLWELAAGLVPVIVPVDPPGTNPGTGDAQETNGSQGDLGPGLDPLG